MKLADYVRKVGPEDFASRFGCSIRAAQSYQYGVRTPRPALAQRIVSSTPVTWAGIYGAERRAG
jgi:hypothetical protein